MLFNTVSKVDRTLKSVFNMLEIIYLALLVYQYCAERVFVTLVVDLILSAFIGKGEPSYLTVLFHYDVQGKCKYLPSH